MNFIVLQLSQTDFIFLRELWSMNARKKNLKKEKEKKKKKNKSSSTVE